MDGSPCDERELAPDEGPSGAGRRLLLVGRDPEARAALRAILEPRGYAVTEAEADQGLGAALEEAQGRGRLGLVAVVAWWWWWWWWWW